MRALRLARDLELRRAAHVFTPSAYLRELAMSWGVHADRVSVLPNPAPPLPELPPRAELRRSFELDGDTLAFAGRLTAQKSLDVALAALARVDGVTLLIAGDGDQRAPLERRAAELGLAGRVRFLGPQPRERVLELFRAADASFSRRAGRTSRTRSSRRSQPARRCSRPRRAVSPRSCATERTACSSRSATLTRSPTRSAATSPTPTLRERLRAAAAPSVAAYAPERIFGRLEETLLRVAHTSE